MVPLHSVVPVCSSAQNIWPTFVNTNIYIYLNSMFLTIQGAWSVFVLGVVRRAPLLCIPGFISSVTTCDRQTRCDQSHFLTSVRTTCHRTPSFQCQLEISWMCILNQVVSNPTAVTGEGGGWGYSDTWWQMYAQSSCSWHYLALLHSLFSSRWHDYDHNIFCYVHFRFFLWNLYYLVPFSMVKTLCAHIHRGSTTYVSRVDMLRNGCFCTSRVVLE